MSIVHRYESHGDYVLWIGPDQTVKVSGKKIQIRPGECYTGDVARALRSEHPKYCRSSDEDGVIER